MTKLIESEMAGPKGLELHDFQILENTRKLNKSITYSEHVHA